MKTWTRWIFAGLIVCIALGAWFHWRWSQVSQHADLVSSYALPPAEGTSLAQLIDQLGQEKSDESGFLPLDRSLEALSWRLAFIDSAERSLDAQYYLWHDDTSGGLLTERILRAADRGVRVRLLIDDMTAKTDKVIAAIHAHPNIELRLFNPGTRRFSAIGRLLEMILNIGRLNHRMHNKLLVADNLLGIIGGRNIGDEYFGLSTEGLNFRDLDLLALGPVVPEMSSSFDLYWNSELALPLTSIRSIKISPEDLSAFRSYLSQRVQDIKIFAAEAEAWLQPQDWTDDFLSLKDRLFWGKADVVFDLPSLEEKDTALNNMVRELRELSAETHEELFFVSAYFVPRAEGARAIQEAAERGLRLRILTNSLASTDVVAVHSGYAPYRKDLLRAGVELYEFRPDAKVRRFHEHPSATAERFGLHTKSVVYDRESIYVGSLNLDPRAMELNTEIGVFVQSPALAETIIAMFERDLLPENSWRLELDRDEQLVWHSEGEATGREPAYRFVDRMSNTIFHLLPIEGQL